MAQFDVFPNPNPRSRETVPYVVDIQSALLESLPTRLVMPLSRVGLRPEGMPRRLAPTFVIDGERVALYPHEAAAVDAKLLKRRVDTLLVHGGEIRDALDAVLSGV